MISFATIPVISIVIALISGSVLLYILLSKSKNQNTEHQRGNENNKIITNQIETSNSNKKLIRVYVDGCWDLMHSGHYNALRQAKGLGDVLVVGVHTDDEIKRNKREPVMNNEQRMAAVTACKYADEVIFGVPYSPSIELLDKHNCDYVAHGDDIPIAADGHSAYHTVMHRLKIFRRTPGVSTTHLIQRLLDASKSIKNKNKTIKNKLEMKDEEDDDDSKIQCTSSWSSFLSTASRISAFANDRIPSNSDKVVYIDGVFDLFHIGHIAALKKAKEYGTYLYVGLYDDETVRKHLGSSFPLMNLQERVLNVLSCKYVDDVIIGAPWKITSQVLKVLNVSYVVVTPNTKFVEDEFDRYNIARDQGIFIELETDSNYTTNDLMKRVEEHTALEKQNKNRVEKAIKYVEEQAYVQET